MEPVLILPRLRACVRCMRARAAAAPPRQLLASLSSCVTIEAMVRPPLAAFAAVLSTVSGSASNAGGTPTANVLLTGYLPYVKPSCVRCQATIHCCYHSLSAPSLCYIVSVLYASRAAIPSRFHLVLLQVVEVHRQPSWGGGEGARRQVRDSLRVCLPDLLPFAAAASQRDRRH